MNDAFSFDKIVFSHLSTAHKELSFVKIYDKRLTKIRIIEISQDVTFIGQLIINYCWNTCKRKEITIVSWKY